MESRTVFFATRSRRGRPFVIQLLTDGVTSAVRHEAKTDSVINCYWLLAEAALLGGGLRNPSSERGPPTFASGIGSCISRGNRAS